MDACCLSDFVTPTDWRLTVATDGIAPLLVDSVLHLMKTPLIASPDTVIGDITEADFSGYAEVDPYTYSAAGLTTDGHAQLAGVQATFQVGAAPTIFNVIYGAYLTSDTGDLIGIWMFPDPIPMDVEARQLNTSVEYLVPGG